MSQRFKRIILILKPRIPVKEGTKLYTGFEALSGCHGKSYEYFRKLEPEPKDSPKRLFSPSRVWKKAEEYGYARFDDSPSLCVIEVNAAGKNVTARVEYSKPVETDAAFPQLNDVRQLVIVDHTTLDLPGIYAWKIEGIGVYIGKYSNRSRPLGAYQRNVYRLLCGLPYRPQKPLGFRRVHRALAQAVKDGLGIELHVLENCLSDNLADRERYWIGYMAEGGLNG